ncbi:MAG: hypothetical protein ABI742_09920 [Gemmatimonadota bacterium]
MPPDRSVDIWVPRLQGEVTVTTSLVYDPMRMTGFSHAQLVKAFERVRNPRDWKGPIFSEIPEAERRVVQKAVFWFTGTVPVFAPAPRDIHRLMVTAVGYRLGPAGDLNEMSQ